MILTGALRSEYFLSEAISSSVHGRRSTLFRPAITASRFLAPHGTGPKQGCNSRRSNSVILTVEAGFVFPPLPRALRNSRLLVASSPSSRDRELAQLASDACGRAIECDRP